jgi:hypothetical protein
MDRIERIKQQTQQQAELAERTKQAQSQLNALQALDQRMIEIARYLVKYMDGKITKTVVTNQLKTIGTPDALKVEKAVNEMHSTLKKHKNTDLSEVVKVMKSVLGHVAQLPKDNPTFEAKEAVSITNLPDFDKYYSKLEKAIARLDIKPEVKVDSPKIQVKPADVVVQAPDLSALTKDLKAVIKAVQSITIPEVPKTDLSELEKRQDQANRLLKEIIDKPVPSYKTDLPFENTEGKLQRITLTAENKLPVEATLPPPPSYLIRNIAEDATYKYFGFEVLDSGAWRIMRKTLATNVFQYATGESDYAAAWTNRAAETYS